METNYKAEGKRSLKEIEEGEEDEEDEDVGFGDDEKKKKKLLGKKGSCVGGSPSLVSCQVENCTANMADSKRYHRRHKVCEDHAKAPIVLVAGFHQRFCQQCSRFHAVSEFDDNKKSCRRRLAGHNERRRKSSPYNQGEGSN